MADYSRLPPGLPVPMDDGAADHLSGLDVPAIALPSTLGGSVNLADAARGCLVAYVYPRTGTPGRLSPQGWDEFPGARGCTPQSCAYRDALGEFSAQGATLVGISAQSATEQLEFAGREHIPFPLLSDRDLRLAAAIGLPTFEIAGMTLCRRLTFVAVQGTIAKVFYPVFPPDRDAVEVLGWLRSRG
jgi:peroxiredoxin